MTDKEIFNHLHEKLGVIKWFKDGKHLILVLLEKGNIINKDAKRFLDILSQEIGSLRSWRTRVENNEPYLSGETRFLFLGGPTYRPVLDDSELSEEQRGEKQKELSDIDLKIGGLDNIYENVEQLQARYSAGLLNFSIFDQHSEVIVDQPHIKPKPNRRPHIVIDNDDQILQDIVLEVSSGGVEGDRIWNEASLITENEKEKRELMQSYSPGQIQGIWKRHGWKLEIIS